MKIRVWWLNRALLYWIPAIFVYDVVATVSRHGVGAALTNIAIAVLIALFFEHYLFSYKVDLTTTRLMYSEGLLSKKEISLERDNIEVGSFLGTPILSKLKSARLLLRMKDGNDVVLSLAAFRPEDIAKIIDWLPVKPT